MRQSIIPKNEHHELNLLHFKLIAKLTLITGLSAVAVLLVLLFVISSEGEGSYLDIIQAHSVTRLQLGSSMFIAALVVLITVAVSVWLIALYSSFRIAGPLYRLAKNLHTAMCFGKQHQIRRDDVLHDVARDVCNSVGKLEQHYRELKQVVDELLDIVEHGDIETANAALTRLREIESKVQLND